MVGDAVDQKLVADRVRELESNAIQEAMPYAQGGIQMATVIVANLILINGGGLLVFPVYLKDIDQTTLASTLVVWSAGAFVVGLVLALSCGYIAYLNYQWQMKFRVSELHAVTETLREESDTTSFHRLRSSRSIFQQKIAKSNHWTRKFIFWSFVVGQASGIGSLSFFIYGCYLAGRVMLGTH